MQIAKRGGGVSLVHSCSFLFRLVISNLKTKRINKTGINTVRRLPSFLSRPAVFVTKLFVSLRKKTDVERQRKRERSCWHCLFSFPDKGDVFCKLAIDFFTWIFLFCFSVFCFFSFHVVTNVNRRPCWRNRRTCTFAALLYWTNRGSSQLHIASMISKWNLFFYYFLMFPSSAFHFNN